MIDHTSSRIGKLEQALLRQNRQRYAFYRMLHATDRVLGRLEEMNRDGVKTVPARLRAEIRKIADTMPAHVREPLSELRSVQDTLDRLFEVQERLFRWRHPGWHDWDPDEAEVVAS